MHATVYTSLILAFVYEVRYADDADVNCISRMMNYLLGTYDYYKSVNKDKDGLTLIKTYNMQGTLNRPGVGATIIDPQVELPTELINIRRKPNSDTTVEMCLNNGWTLSFRIHSGDGKVKPSLKFNVQLLGMLA